eukprot:TRINITY_DN6151_c0_g3_i3.p1 TRINITY_DN6151_c0_g3~~TRINITY_DN6151_c0_g3_i3.p1  ORF type:complete len:291 (-),score=72.09 TRINITY_DN6151_c0_g3_i3:105-977(-)
MREAGIRVLLHCVSQIAVRYKKVITPLICFFSDFYFRIFVQVKSSPKESLEVVNGVSVVPSCINCQYYHLQKLQGHIDTPIDKCPVCKSALKMLGPIWNGDIDKLEFVDQLLTELKSFNFKTNEKIFGLLMGIKDELEAKVPPLGVYTHIMISEIKSNSPNLKTIMSGLQSLGYVSVQSAVEEKCLKTTAPIPVVYDMLKHLKKTKFPELAYVPKKLQETSYNYQILVSEVKLAKEPNYKEYKPKHAKVPKYFPNPEANWGPKARAKEKRAQPEGKEEEETTLKKHKDST